VSVFKNALWRLLLPAWLGGWLSALPVQAADVGIGFRVDGDWDAQANVTFTVTNATEAAIANWTLEFDFGSTISPYSHAKLVSHTGKHHALTNLSYGIIPANGTLSFQCSATPGGLGQTKPTGCLLNRAPVGEGGSEVTQAVQITVTILPTPPSNDTSPQLAPLTNSSVGLGSFLSTRGNQIVDGRGNPVRITGLNWFGFETGNKVLHGLWTRGYQEALGQIRGLGFNTLRLPFSNEMLAQGAAAASIDFNKNPDLRGLTPLQVLDKIIAYCGQIGLRVILDRHSARADGYMNEDVWYIPRDGYHTEQRWMEDWVMLATRYAGNPTVIGADLFNEPKKTATWGADSPATDWNKAAERCGNAILAANPNWLVIVEGTEKFAGSSTWWGGNLKGAAAHPVVLNVSNKLVYSMHEYPASMFVQKWFNDPGYPKNLGRVWDGFWGYLFRGNTAPLLLGEFGSKLATSRDQQWLEKLMAYIDGDFALDGGNGLAPGQKGISWTFWCFNPNSGDTGGLLNDDWTTVNQTKLRYVVKSLAPMLGSADTNRQPDRALLQPEK
jgi:aryl-phospho-beta-D-glucosidase BglC (GH1 family)